MESPREHIKVGDKYYLITYRCENCETNTAVYNSEVINMPPIRWQRLVKSYKGYSYSIVFVMEISKEEFEDYHYDENS